MDLEYIPYTTYDLYFSLFNCISLALRTPIFNTAEIVCVLDSGLAALLVASVIGILGGFTGVFIIRGYVWTMWLRKRWPKWFIFQPYVWTIIVGLITALLTFEPLVGSIMSLPLGFFIFFFFIYKLKM